MEFADVTELHTVPVTTENIHEVKVALTMSSTKHTRKEKNEEWVSWTFKILYPHLLPVYLTRDNAKPFFDDIKTKRNIQHGELQLSWWFIKEVEKEYQEKFIAGGANDESLSNKISSKSKKAVKELAEESTSPASKPNTAVKGHPLFEGD